MGKTATCWCAVFLLLFSAFLYAADIPFLSGRVNDTAGILFPNTIHDLEALLKAHEDSTSNQVAVLTISSLEGEPIENYSMRVVETWKLGRKGKDNGVLLLVARDDREVRIEVGYGLEGSLPDITCSRIVQNEIIPRFKDGDFDGGVRAGVLSIIVAINGAYTADDTGDESGDIGGRIIAFLIFFVVVGMFTTIAIVSTGCQSWFLFVFLIPFWFLFPTSILGFTPGIALFVLYIVSFIASKFFFAGSDTGKRLQKKWTSSGMFASSGRGWSSSGGSSGGGFSGGGGSFGGGGASGKW